MRIVLSLRKERTLRDTHQEFFLPPFHQLFPGGTVQGMLELSDWLPISIVECFAEKRVVRHSESSSLITVCNVYDLNCIGQYGEAVCFEQLQHDWLTRSTFNSQNAIGTTIGFDLVIDAAVKWGVRFHRNTEVAPRGHPFNIFAIQLQRGQSVTFPKKQVFGFLCI